jgi:hypothetical protein
MRTEMVLSQIWRDSNHCAALKPSSDFMRAGDNL